VHWCGKIEAPQTCIGICQDRKVELVHRYKHEETLAQLEAARHQVHALAALAQRLARTTPHDDEWERSYQALQWEARRTLTAIGCASD
jgi:hypothetical protein